ncbi:MAG: hypothetical protein JWO78_168 [Micavibrio sp.]|nr:hypothetical protein [Micavibrio sp.]
MGVNSNLDTIRRLRGQLEADVEGLSDGINKENFKTACLELADEVAERECTVAALKQRIAELQERKSRVEASVETIRDVILQAMSINEQNSIKGDLVTLSISDRDPSVHIIDESKIPARFFKQPAPELDKKELTRAVLKDGEVIDGTEVGNGKIVLTIRRK